MAKILKFINYRDGLNTCLEVEKKDSIVFFSIYIEDDVNIVDVSLDMYELDSLIGYLAEIKEQLEDELG